PAPTVTYPLSLHDALPIWRLAASRGARTLPVVDALAQETQHRLVVGAGILPVRRVGDARQGHFFGIRENRQQFIRQTAEKLRARSEEHTSELQSRENLVCR